ncbi:hypothetical protein HanPI659440_Chr09g0354201 [Helianthus annuus]|nr:hypothetical protein HanPI659440_Chr09g0354201 [Helianthus annuus]
MLAMFTKHGLLMKIKFEKLLVCWTRQILSYQNAESCLVGFALNHIKLIRPELLLLATLFVIHAGQPTLAHLSIMVLDV